MHPRHVLLVLAGVAALLLPAGLSAAPAAGARDVSVCATAQPGFARCHARVRTDVPADRFAITISGYTPADLQSAYNLPSASAGRGQTVAIVDAYDDPNAESDMAIYRATFGLPACSTANGCFRKANQSGLAAPLPAANAGWSEEISLDLDMVSAVCPNCHILLVEANSAAFTDLGASVDTAATLGARAIGNSYGGAEYPGETVDQAHYNHPGVAITVSSGDNGTNAKARTEFPAASQYVTAVGGTSLTRGGRSGWSESAWSGAGSGCSRFIAKPAWQHDPACAKRSVADVSAVADPYTGVLAYDTFHVGGWLIFGGTSVSAQIISATYALAGNEASTVAGSYPYAHRNALQDVTDGSNGPCGNYLCNAGPGYDGPTGLGTPYGVRGF